MHAQILRKCKAKTGGSRVGCKSSYILTLSPTVVVLRLLIKSISKSCRRDILSLTTSPKMKCHLYYRTINIPKEMIQNLWHLEVCHWPPNSFFFFFQVYISWGESCIEIWPCPILYWVFSVDLTQGVVHSIIVSSIQGQLDSDEIFWMNTHCRLYVLSNLSRNIYVSAIILLVKLWLVIWVKWWVPELY